MTVYTIGIDISKASLEVCRLPDGERRRFANDRSGWRRLKAWLSGLAVAPLVYEPALTQLPSEAFRDLQALMAARQVLIDDRTAIGNRLEALLSSYGDELSDSAKELRRYSRYRSTQIARHLAAIDNLLEKGLSAHPDLEAKHRIVASIPGIGWHTAISMLAEMPELGALSGGQAGCLAGLAPITRESGKWKGKSFIQGGRKTLRQALYMPALVAIQHNPSLKAKYDAFKAIGKPSKVAIVAVMRKLVVLANALLRDGRIWSEKAPCA